MRCVLLGFLILNFIVGRKSFDLDLLYVSYSTQSINILYDFNLSLIFSKLDETMPYFMPYERMLVSDDEDENGAIETIALNRWHLKFSYCSL